MTTIGRTFMTPRHIRFGLFLSALGCGVLQGCDVGSSTCESDFEPAVKVTVRDSVTDGLITLGAFGVLEDGSYRDVMLYHTDASNLPSLWGGLGRVGTYTVTVTRDGYVSWQRTGVVVHTQDACHLGTAYMVARLVPAP